MKAFLKKLLSNLSSSKNNNNEIISKIATFFFLLPIFFNRISFGAAEEYDEGNSINLPTHQVEAFIMFGLLIILIRIRKVPQSLLSYLFFFAVSILTIQIFYVIFYHISPIYGETMNYIYRFFRAYIYVIGIFIYSIFFFDEFIFYNYFKFFCKIVTYAGLGAYTSYILFGSTLLLHNQSEYYRIQCFFSEPSGCSAVLTAFFLLLFFERRKKEMIIVFVTIIFTRSPTTYITLLISFILISIITSKYRAIIGILTVCITFILFSILLTIDLTEIGTYFFKSDSNILSVIGRLLVGIDVILKGELDTGGNARFTGVMTLFKDMSQYNLYWTGYGFNSSPEFFIIKYGEIRDFGLIYTMLFSYGIIGVLVFYYFVFKSLRTLYIKQNSILYIYTPFLVSSFINSAQGFVMYQIVFLGVFYYSLNKKKNDFKIV